MTLAEYFEKRFRQQHGGLLDVDGTGVVGESGDGELVLWKSISARANVRSGVRIATSELPLRVNHYRCGWRQQAPLCCNLFES